MGFFKEAMVNQSNIVIGVGEAKAAFLEIYNVISLVKTFPRVWIICVFQI